MNYQIIKDEKLLLDFIGWLPDLKDNEVYCANLFARSKYCKDITHIRSDEQQVQRIVSKKEYLFEKIKQLECPVGSYRQKGKEIPQEALALYITINPRSLVKAGLNCFKKLAEMVGTDSFGRCNPYQMALSEVQKAIGRKLYYDMDFDNADLDKTIRSLNKLINDDCYRILKTRGGFHIIVELSKIDKKFSKTWYKAATSLAGCDLNRDNMIPVPGTSQGMFMPHFIK